MASETASSRQSIETPLHCAPLVLKGYCPPLCISSQRPKRPPPHTYTHTGIDACAGEHTYTHTQAHRHTHTTEATRVQETCPEPQGGEEQNGEVRSSLRIALQPGQPPASPFPTLLFLKRTRSGNPTHPRCGCPGGGCRGQWTRPVAPPSPVGGGGPRPQPRQVTPLSEGLGPRLRGNFQVGGVSPYIRASGHPRAHTCPDLRAEQSSRAGLVLRWAFAERRTQRQISDLLQSQVGPGVGRGGV